MSAAQYNEVSAQNCHVFVHCKCRSNGAVADMRWAPDWRHVCIAYADGMALVGGTAGERLKQECNLRTCTSTCPSGYTNPLLTPERARMLPKHS